MAVELSANGSSGLGHLLLEAANPNIYRINAFRILELPVDCGDRDIRKRTQMVDYSQKIGQSPQPGPGRALPLEPAVDEYTFLAAVQRLRDPEPRFIDEFFWFWPHDLGQGSNDEALKALKDNDLEGAVEIWVDFVNNYSTDNVSMHNLAVLAHASALDLEARAAAHPLNSSDLQKLDTYWRQTFKRWNTLKNNDNFWRRLEGRVREFSDPRLNGDTVQLMREMLPLGLLTINAKLAIAASERKDEQGLKRQVEVMNASGFSEAQINDALQRCIEPVRKQVSIYCKNAQSQAERDPVHADEVAATLLDQCEQQMITIDRLLPPNSPTRQAVHDEVALCGLNVVVTFGNKTENWAEALQLLKRFEPYAMGRSTINRIEENLRTLKGNLDSGNDWCADGYYDLPEPIQAELENARELMKSERFEESITILEQMLQQVEERYRPMVRKPLATCLNLRSNVRFARATEELNRPRWLVEQIRQNVAAGHSDVLMTAVAVKSDGEQYAASTGTLVCMSCRKKVNKWVTFTYQDIKMLACPECSERDDEELERRKVSFSAALQEGYRDLSRAIELDPSNQSVKNNLEALRQIASDVGVPLTETGRPKESKARHAEINNARETSAQARPRTSQSSEPGIEQPESRSSEASRTQTPSRPAQTKEPRVVNTGQANLLGIVIISLIFGLGFGFINRYLLSSSLLGQSLLFNLLRTAIFAFFPLGAAYVITYRASTVFWTSLLGNMLFFIPTGLASWKFWLAEIGISLFAWVVFKLIEGKQPTFWSLLGCIAAVFLASQLVFTLLFQVPFTNFLWQGLVSVAFGAFLAYLLGRMIKRA